MLFSISESTKKIWMLGAGKNLAAYTLGAIICSALTVANPFFLGLFIDNLVYDGKPQIYFLILVSNAFLCWYLNLHLRKVIIRIARDSELDIQNRLLAAFQRMKPSAVDGYGNGEIAIKFYRDTGNFEQFIAGFCPQFIRIIFGFIFSLIVVACKQPMLTVLYLFFLPIMVGSLIFYEKKLTRTTRSIRSIYDHSINGIFEFMHSFPYLKSMAAEKPYFSSPKSKFRNYRKMNTVNDMIVASSEFFNHFLLLTGEYSVLAIAGWMAWKKIIPIGDVVMFQLLFLSVLNSFSGLFHLLPNWKTTQESMNSIYELLNTAETEEVECNPPIPSALNDIAVKHISFSYPHTRKKVFEDFSCTVKAGSIIALTGINGSGKTTLLKLLTGYLLPDSGYVEIAGKKLCGWQIKSFRQKISYVFQDSLLISGTIRDNITLKNRNYTESDIVRALQFSGADELVARLPDGLNHKIGQDGGGLSGGERQKIAIARALIRDPDILIFDEVTNHLDYESRIKIRDLMISFRGRKTVIMVSHDPELIRLCDQEIKL